jgi:hypothetical protein
MLIPSFAECNATENRERKKRIVNSTIFRDKEPCSALNNLCEDNVKPHDIFLFTIPCTRLTASTSVTSTMTCV